MKAIMISIKPQYVEKILNGEKTIEIRKTKPKFELPCKVYIYCTNGYVLYDLRNEDYLELKNNFTLDVTHESNRYLSGTPPMLNRKVVAEFTLNKIDKFDSAYSEWTYSVAPEGSEMPISETQFIQMAEQKGKLDCDDLLKYFGDENYIAYMWYIDNLKIYDEPKELSEFRKDLDCDDYPCNKNRDCKYNYYDHSEGCWACGIDFDGSNCIYKHLTRPPQSWCYVEELENV